MDAFTRHQIYLQRFATQEANKFEPFLRDADKVIREVLTKQGELISNQAALTVATKELRGQLGEVYGDYVDLLLVDLEDLSGRETDFTVDTLDKGVEGDILAPTVAAVWAFVLLRPMSLGGSLPDTLKAFVGSIQVSEVKRVTNIVRSGFFERTPVSEILTQIRGTKANRFTDGALNTTNNNARTIAKTSVNHTAVQSKNAVFRKNDRLVGTVEWSSVLDSRTSTICRTLDGDIFPVDSGPRPPAHPNCLAGDTIVTTCSDVSNVYGRAYKGRMIDVFTASGRKITITPNHPVLTARGWVDAGEINCLDQLVCVDDTKGISDKHENSTVAKFSDIFSAANVSVESSLVRSSPSTPEDFHGDGSHGDVSIIYIDSLAWGGVKSILNEKVQNDTLTSREAGAVSLNSCGSLGFGFSGLSCASDRIVGGFRELCSLLRGRFIHSCLLLFRPISRLPEMTEYKLSNGVSGAANTQVLCDTGCANTGVVGVDDGVLSVLAECGELGPANGDACSSESPVDWLVSNAEDLPDLIDAMTVNGAELDNVVDVVVREDVSLHVYNLGNRDNWYIANGIITHNCRSQILPIINPERAVFKGNEERTAKGATGTTKSGASQYYNWLATQPASFQNDVLGKTQGKLFRNGGISNDQFRKLTTDNFGQPLSLDEIKKKDRKAWNEANL